MQCHDFREIADSYLSDELLVETNHDVMRHLESCAGCRGELAARRNLRAQLRTGFQQASELTMRDDFPQILQTELLNAVRRHSRSLVARRIAYGAIAASLVFAVALGFRAALQSPFIQNVRNPVSASLLDANLIENAVGDHQNCAIVQRLAEKPINLEEAGRTYDPVYIDLAKVVMSGGVIPAGMELVDAHSCVFNGQRFAHVVLRYHGEIVSLLITRSGSANPNVSNVSQGEPLIVSAQANGQSAAHFQTGRHAVFVVSALGDSENIAIARAIAAAVSKHIQRAEIAG